MPCYVLLITTAVLLLTSAAQTSQLTPAEAEEDLDYFEVRAIVRETLDKATRLSASMSVLPSRSNCPLTLRIPLCYWSCGRNCWSCSKR